MADPVFKGRVLPGGLLVLHRPKDYARHCATLAGKYVEVICRVERRKRTNKQNQWLWGYAYRTLLLEFGYDPLNRDEWKRAIWELHEALVGRCFGTHYNERIGAEVRNARTSKLSTTEFSTYMEWLPRHAAENYHVVLMLPNEVDYSSIPDEDAA